MKVRSILALLSVTTSLFAADPMSPMVPKPGAPLKISCVGDSITQGVGAGKGKSYPTQLQELLGKEWEVGNFGVSGRTLMRKGDHPYWSEAAFKKAQDFKPDAVIIMLGTNDTKRQNWVHKDEFESDYRDLVKTFKDLNPSPRIYLCRPVPVTDKGAFGINEAGIQEQMPIIDKLVKEFNIGVIDMHAALKKNPEMLPDHVHPNAAGAGEMAKAAFEVLTGKVLEGAISK